MTSRNDEISRMIYEVLKHDGGGDADDKGVGNDEVANDRDRPKIKVEA